jgi:hypothetical protein
MHFKGQPFRDITKLQDFTVKKSWVGRMGQENERIDKPISQRP